MKGAKYFNKVKGADLTNRCIIASRYEFFLHLPSYKENNIPHFNK